MSEPFKDHFKAVAQQYADSRPTYPKRLFSWLAAQCSRLDLAWDCATGNGQAALDLAACFEHVVATDASAAQLAQAPAHDRIEYRVAPAERSGLADASVDLLTVAQALHWFDVAAFHEEARRVLKPTGIIAEWCYGMIAVDDAAIDGLIQNFYQDVVGPYWPPERMHVEKAYRDLPFPFRQLPVPAFSMQAAWTLDQLAGYLRSWSATGMYIKANGSDPVSTLAEELLAVWGDPAHACEITWPLALRVGSAQGANK
jgi:ubiquinone/menaquinone biosynthesis C-methylase UbiE